MAKVRTPLITVNIKEKVIKTTPLIMEKAKAREREMKAKEICLLVK